MSWIHQPVARPACGFDTGRNEQAGRWMWLNESDRMFPRDCRGMKTGPWQDLFSDNTVNPALQ